MLLRAAADNPVAGHRAGGEPGGPGVRGGRGTAGRDDGEEEHVPPEGIF